MWSGRGSVTSPARRRSGPGAGVVAGRQRIAFATADGLRDGERRRGPEALVAVPCRRGRRAGRRTAAHSSIRPPEGEEGPAGGGAPRSVRGRRRLTAVDWQPCTGRDQVGCDRLAAACSATTALGDDAGRPSPSSSRPRRAATRRAAAQAGPGHGAEHGTLAARLHAALRVHGARHGHLPRQQRRARVRGDARDGLRRPASPAAPGPSSDPDGPAPRRSSARGPSRGWIAAGARRSGFVRSSVRVHLRLEGAPARREEEAGRGGRAPLTPGRVLRCG